MRGFTPLTRRAPSGSHPRRALRGAWRVQTRERRAEERHGSDRPARTRRQRESSGGHVRLRVLAGTPLRGRQAPRVPVLTSTNFGSNAVWRRDGPTNLEKPALGGGAAARRRPAGRPGWRPGLSARRGARGTPGGSVSGSGLSVWSRALQGRKPNFHSTE